jgi:hypothetical protein
MAKFGSKKQRVIKGTEEEQKLFSEVDQHYSMASEDLDIRTTRKNGFDDADKMFASYIDEGSWPYRSLMFDPRPYTFILEKTARLIGSKPKGRLVPREGGDTLGAYINNELLSFQWDDNGRLGDPMISKWIMMDQNARKYGSSFMVVKWRYDKTEDGVFYDGPDVVVCNARDVLANPSYPCIKKWFQHREWVTLDELEKVNDISSSKSVYKNLDLLRDSLDEDKGQRGDKRIQLNKNKEMKGLTDFTGRDETYPTIEIITEYRPGRWITFAPKHGVIIRDIPNPYKHKEIPVVHLKYYPLPDDLYGVSELEPVAKQIRAINAHLSAYSDTIALALRPPLHVNPINTRMHTLSWDPEAKWLMNTPNVDVQQMRIDTSITQNFQSIYSVLTGSLMNAIGEQSQGISATNPFEDAGRVTATEIKDTAFQRNVRDNMNQIFLSEAIKKQIMFWHSMNQQYMFKGSASKQRVIRIVGRDAIEFFQRQGLSDIRPTDQDAQMVAMNQLNPQEIIPGPRFAVNVGEDETGNPVEVPKMIMDETGEGANLIIEEGDLEGNYDYIPDIESMQPPSSQQLEAKLGMLLTMVTNPAIIQQLAQEGKKPKVSEILIKMIEATKIIKDADSLFEDLQEGGINVQGAINQGGTGTPEAGSPAEGNVPNSGMEGNSSSMGGAENPQFMGGSPVL